MSITGEKLKNSNIWRLNNTLLNNQQITEEIKNEIKICIEMNKNENTTTQNLWDTGKSSAKGKVHSNTILPQETREKSNKYPIFTAKETRKRRNEEPQG